MIRIKLLISSFFMMSFQLLFSNNHFIPAYLEFSDNPYLPHNITITSAILNGVDLESGDEIGIFDGDVCVGSGVVDDLISAPSNMLALVASAQDGSTPGFTALNEISYRFWDSSAMSEKVRVNPSGMRYVYVRSHFESRHGIPQITHIP